MLNTGINFTFENGASETILSLTIKKRIVGKITGFRRAYATSDAPQNESWSYAYVIIHIESNIFLIQAYRAYSAQAIYQRICNGDSWSGGWFAFEGKSL